MLINDTEEQCLINFLICHHYAICGGSERSCSPRSLTQTCPFPRLYALSHITPIFCHTMIFLLTFSTSTDPFIHLWSAKQHLCIKSDIVSLVPLNIVAIFVPLYLGKVSFVEHASPIVLPYIAKVLHLTVGLSELNLSFDNSVYFVFNISAKLITL